MNSKVDLAGVWLLELLQDQDMLAADIYLLGSEHDPQFLPKTLRRAKEKLGLVVLAKPSAREFTKNELEQLKAMKVRNVNVDEELDEEIEGLQSSVKQQSGRIRWFWGFPSDPDRYKLSTAEIERQREHHLSEAQHLADILHKINRRARATEQPPTTAPVSPVPEPEPPAIPPEPVVANRIRF